MWGWVASVVARSASASFEGDVVSARVVSTMKGKMTRREMMRNGQRTREETMQWGGRRGRTSGRRRANDPDFDIWSNNWPGQVAGRLRLKKI